MNDTAFMVKKIVGLHLKYISNLTQPQLFLLFLFHGAFGKTNSQHLRDEIIRSTDQMGRKMIQY